MAVHVLTDDDATTYLSLGVTPRDIVRLALPDACDATADYLLWEFTPWPMVQGVHDIADAVADAFDQHAESGEWSA